MRRWIVAGAALLAFEGVARADGIVIETENDKGTFEMDVQLRIESLWDLTVTDESEDARFSVARGRLQLEGHAFTEKLRYKFQTDFGKGAVTLKDFWFEAEVAPNLRLRSGQWKRPYSRQQMTSSGKLEMTSRAITDKAFRGGRDVGVALHNGYESSPELEWVFGVFNGTGDNTVPTGWMPAFVGRIGYNHGGIKGYSEADLEGGPLRYGVGLSLYGETDFDRDSVRTHQAEVDGIMKLEGLDASAAVYGLTSNGAEQLGAHVQAGYLCGEGMRRFQPTARYAIVKPEGADPTHEVMLGVGWWPYGHNAKVLVNAGMRGDDFVAQVGFDAGFF